MRLQMAMDAQTRSSGQLHHSDRAINGASADAVREQMRIAELLRMADDRHKPATMYR